MDRDYEEPFDDEEHWTVEVAEDALSLPPEWVTVGPDVTDAVLGHPSEAGLRGDRLPHIWCPGCGIGIAVTCFVEALDEAGIDRDSLSVVSGIGCTGRVAGYMDCDSFHTIHGRAVPFALGLHLGNPELNVVVFSGDGDLVAIGGNHLIHAARRNADLTVFCVNNFTYGMTGGQSGPTTQDGAPPSPPPPRRAAAGATYVARWTVLDLGRVRRSMVEALQHKGFAFVEIVSPCPTYYGRRNQLGEAIDELRHYRENTVVQNFASPDELDLALSGKIVVGKFVEKERPTFLDLLQQGVVPRAQEALARG